MGDAVFSLGQLDSRVQKRELVSAEGSHSDAGSVCADNQPELPPSIERTGGIGDSRPPSFHPNTGGSRENLDNETETDSVVLLQRERPRRKEGPEHGSDVVDWLYQHVEGFTDRRESRKYASNLLKAGYIRHTVNKITFSEQCYYIFGDLCGSTDPF
uniref:Uncharacterized protein n=1 Tax=Sphaerodactylus townsendi TaxID=933632 RepID=A0ACB8FBX5_9SAUR